MTDKEVRQCLGAVVEEVRWNLHVERMARRGVCVDAYGNEWEDMDDEEWDEVFDDIFLLTDHGKKVWPPGSPGGTRSCTTACETSAVFGV